MKIMFADEVKGEVNKKLFGVCLVVIDHSKYSTIHNQFTKTLIKVGWPQNEEFKGKYLFANNPVKSGKSPEEMIDIVKEIVEYLTSSSNSRGNVYFVYNFKGQSPDNYINLLNNCIKTIKKAQSQRLGKHLVALMLDDFNELHNPEVQININKTVQKSLAKRSYKLIESNVCPIKSNNQSVGICYADVIAYISRWIVENPKQKTNGQISLFDLYSKEIKSQILIKKIDTTRELGSMIKNIRFIKIS